MNGKEEFLFSSEYKKSCGFANSKSQDFSYSVTS